MVKGVGLISGGLDSILATKILQDQGIEVIGVSFVTPFFESEKAKRSAEMLGIRLEVIDISYPHLEIVRSPRYGYGKGMNPCIDCHAMMFRFAGKVMEAEGADFLFSGEVLGERPMSQNFKALMTVAKESGYEDLIVRPLSAKLLPETLPEREGKVDREKLLDIKGRSRKRQMELAAHYGIAQYSQPAGGCRLTEPGYARKLRELIKNSSSFEIRDVRLLAIGRHFRLRTGEKVILGRNQNENEIILSMKDERDIILDVRDYPSPVAMIPYGADKSAIAKAASILVFHSDAPPDERVIVNCAHKGNVYDISAEAISKEEIDKIRV